MFYCHRKQRTQRTIIENVTAVCTYSPITQDDITIEQQQVEHTVKHINAPFLKHTCCFLVPSSWQRVSKLLTAGCVHQQTSSFLRQCVSKCKASEKVMWSAVPDCAVNLFLKQTERFILLFIFLIYLFYCL